MSERGDIFTSLGAGETPTKKKLSRSDLFSNAEIDLPDAEKKQEKPVFHGKGYMDAEAIRKGGFNPITGVGEAGLQTATGTLASAAGGVAGGLNALWNISPAALIAHHFGLPEANSADIVTGIQEAGTYQPRTESGQEVSGAIASPKNPLNWPGVAGQFLGNKAEEAGAPPEISTALRMAPDVAATFLGAKGMREGEIRAEPTPQDLLNAHASKQSMGAAGASVDLQKLSPDLRGAVERAVQKTGGAVNPEVLARQVQADSLPVKVALSEGQSLGDPRLISLEMNARGKHEAYTKGFENQHKALVENLRAMRDEAGPDVFSTNHVEHADTLIGRYKAIDDTRNADIGAKYQALRDAAGGEFPVDTQALAANVKGALKKNLSTNNAPPDVMSALDEYASTGKMSLEDFESLRSTLARVQRTDSRGEVRHAAGIIRRQVEEMPLQPGAEQLKGLADTARNAARERFQALDADPAYKAAVEETTPPDKFVQKFVIGGARDNVARLAEAMKDDESAMQTLKVATLDHLRNAAGIDSHFNGNFTQAGYNKALNALDPKLGSLLDQKTMETARTLGDVARYTQFQPKGSFVNNSNTFVSATAEKAADALEGIINFKTGGIPIASHIRKQMNENKLQKQAEKTFAPGAGLTKLSDLAKLGKTK